MTARAILRLPWRRTGGSSLRMRLFVTIIVPLLGVAMAAGAVRYWQAQTMSQTLYDETLKIVAHAVAREVILTQGDVVSDALLESLVGALGDPIFYNVLAADGRIIAGYTDVPLEVVPADLSGGNPVFFDFVYFGQPVRAVALREFIADPFFDGWTTVMVWQTTTQRRALSLVILQQALMLLGLVVLSAAFFVWLGIARGLRPLTDLREAIALRSASELSPIRRPVPVEVKPLVSTMNSLFERLQAELARRNAFIGNAAHQLRNPVAAIRAQADAALATTDPDLRQARLCDLSQAAGDLSRLSQQLLSLETAVHTIGAATEMLDLERLAADVARRMAPAALSAGVDLTLDTDGSAAHVRGNPVMLREAVENLIDNAIRYGAPQGGAIRLTLGSTAGRVRLAVEDDGPGIPPEAAERVFERFVRLPQTATGGAEQSGCGLGLSIVRSIARAHGGSVTSEWREKGCCMILSLPKAVAAATPGQAPSRPESGRAQQVRA